MPGIRLLGLTKSFGTYHAVRGIDLEVSEGEFIVLVGPSGCGKSTTLRMIAGLEEASAGSILIGEKRVDDVAPKNRNIAMVFPSYALYPHMSVFDNMAFGLKLRGVRRSEIEEQINRTAKNLGLSEYLDRKPRELSGGQRQRVAMGRAIVRNPDVFLFDEPLSNLDAKLRVSMRTEIKRLHQRYRTTTIYVTHDQVEAMTLADRIVVMSGGCIEQVGTPQEIYDHPRSHFVAGFIGSPAMNFLDCRLVDGDGGLIVELEGDRRLRVPASRTERYRGHVGAPMVLGIRPENIGAGHREGETLNVTIEVLEPLGMDTMAYFRVGSNDDLCARLHPKEVSAGDTMSLYFDMEAMYLIDPKTNLVV